MKPYTEVELKYINDRLDILDERFLKLSIEVSQILTLSAMLAVQSEAVKKSPMDSVEAANRFLKARGASLKARPRSKS